MAIHKIRPATRWKGGPPLSCLGQPFHREYCFLKWYQRQNIAFVLVSSRCGLLLYANYHLKSKCQSCRLMPAIIEIALLCSQSEISQIKGVWYLTRFSFDVIIFSRCPRSPERGVLISRSWRRIFEVTLCGPAAIWDISFWDLSDLTTDQWFKNHIPDISWHDCHFS